ncbi:MAG: response regulator [Myxococcales bacterium]|nr:response regulator [Myxococcales bacterium]
MGARPTENSGLFPIAFATAPGDGGTLLVVDDNEVNRDVLSRRLTRQGHRVLLASNGSEALVTLACGGVDMMLLDILMPEMDGYQVLEELKRDPLLCDLPVIMISALGDVESVVRCIEMGAEDYLPKPFDPVLLRARIGSSLAKKRMRDRERRYIEEIRAAQEQSEALLLNVRPKAIADRLKAGESAIADDFRAVTVLFADLVGFTLFAAQRSAARVVKQLNEIFSAFDRLAEFYGVEKIKTIGDAYLAVGGLPVPRPDHAQAIAELALSMREEIHRINLITGEKFFLRIGIHSGPVVAGIIGTKKFSYDLWGDTVNTASRMESHGIADEIQCSVATWQVLKDRYAFEARGTIDVKGMGRMATALLRGRLAAEPI